MALATGTLVGGYANGLRTQVETQLALDASWTFVETVTSTAKTWRVWENDGSHAWANGRKWYLLMYTASTTATDLYFWVAEGYTTTGSKVTGYSGNSGAPTLDADGRRAEVAVTTLSTSYAEDVGSIPSAATYTWYIEVTDHGVYVRHSASSGYWCYAGLFERVTQGLYSDSEDFPLCIAGSSLGASSGGSSFTRLPKYTGTTSDSVLGANWVALFKTYGAIPTGITYLANKSALSRIMLHHNSTPFISRGLLPSWILTSATPAAGVTIGDYITIGSDTYYYQATSPPYYWVK
jgi:hypothetical protein